MSPREATPPVSLRPSSRARRRAVAASNRGPAVDVVGEVAGRALGDPGQLGRTGEVAIDMSARTPKILTIGAVRTSDVCITMGCGDTCPVFPGKRYLDWKLEDPAGQGVEAVRPIRHEIKRLVEDLIAEITPEPTA
ncbi:phosphotyrosine protein phosphatase [Streptomyces sp. MB09-01]|uniref:phosphotyrosine protein phosphatase n=1 Tax=Streptomyces sp. MB09-01 TaxID=3028666 RepID=UPI003A5BF13F